MLRYIDGNNNAYVIEGDHLTYEPVTPAQSSSGTYSGGEPQNVPITDAQRAEITELIEQIIEDIASHIPTRPKGCGTIVLGSSHISFESPAKAELERLLKAVLSGA